jgi:L-seryl-tRNA(Ser) seleniumtransferase
MPYNQAVNSSERMRSLPSVDRLLLHPAIESLLGKMPRSVVVDAVRAVLDEARVAIRDGKDVSTDHDALAQDVCARATACFAPSLRPAINATGVILHTGLGRAVLSPEACAAVSGVAGGHSTLEIDMESGRRGSRQSHVEGLLCKLTGAEAAMVVNNNAAAVFLAINSLAAGSEVIVSRGQLVEIGGGFRVPDIIRRAGCRLVEVGTTNRTRISDYTAAASEDTALVLRVHPSNFRVVGFTEEASIDELVDLGARTGVPVMDDLGSGALIDVSRFGLAREPLVQESVRAGCDIVTFSGDKLLGGPQAGILVGSARAISACRENPIARAVRIDKLSLAALQATLRLYLDPERAIAQIPVLRSIARSAEDVLRSARRLASRLKPIVGQGTSIEVLGVRTEIGGGSLPGQDLPSTALALKSNRFSSEYLGTWFRGYRVPIFGRIESDRLVLDMRSVEPSDMTNIINCVRVLFQGEVP